MTDISPSGLSNALVIIPHPPNAQKEAFDTRTFTKGTDFTFQVQAPRPSEGKFNHSINIPASKWYRVLMKQSIQLARAIQKHKTQPQNQHQIQCVLYFPVLNISDYYIPDHLQQF